MKMLKVYGQMDTQQAIRKPYLSFQLRKLKQGSIWVFTLKVINEII